MGESGYQDLLKQRKDLVSDFVGKLSQIAEKHGERLLVTTKNTISFAITCKNREIGPKLFVRRVSGTRHVSNTEKDVLGFRFRSYGASYDGYPEEYLTAACAIGINSKEIEIFFKRLDDLFSEIKS